MAKRHTVDAQPELPDTAGGEDSQAEVAGTVSCVCTAACAMDGYHDVGDRMELDPKALAEDPFLRSHFRRAED